MTLQCVSLICMQAEHQRAAASFWGQGCSKVQILNSSNGHEYMNIVRTVFLSIPVLFFARTEYSYIKIFYMK